MRSYGFLLAWVLLALPWTAAEEPPGELVDYIVATVNGEPITWSALRLEMRLRNVVTDDPLRRAQLLNLLIDEHLFLQEARDFVIVTDAAVDEEIDRRAQPLSRERYLESLAQRNISEKDLRERIREDRMVTQFIERVFRPKVRPIGAAEVEAYYHTHREAFMTPERVRLQQVLVLAAEKSSDAARKRIEAIRRALADNADAIDRLAEQAKDDPALVVRVETEWQVVDDFLPALQETLRTAPIGAWSNPVATPLGWMLLRVLERKEAEPRPLEAVRNEIVRTLTAARLNEIMTTWLKTRRAASDVRILDSELKRYVNGGFTTEVE